MSFAVASLFVVVAILYSIASAMFLTFLARGQAATATAASRVLSVAAACHVAFVVVETLHTTSHELVDIHQALAVASLFVTVGYLIFTRRPATEGSSPSRLKVLGAFVTPVTLLFFLGAGFRRGAGEVPPNVRSAILPVHIAVNVIGIACFALAFAVAVAYVAQERQLRRKQLGGLFQRLPPLDTLDALSFRLVTLGFPLLTFGVITGTFWAVRIDPDAPRINVTQMMGLATWVLFALVLVLRAVVGWRGRRAAIGTMIGFAFACVVLVGYVLRSAGG